ncbi:MAG: hypothetical protein IKP31_01570 [Lachnospiraceae bacterium]|nr:hypothetical protein [Lachnospiraceae bacterium]
MKTDVISVNSSGAGMEEALALAEKTAQDLPGKAGMRLRLLAEEMMCLVREIAGGMEADFWIETGDDKAHLHLKTDTLMYVEKRKEFLAVSSTGENALAKGMLGKIRNVFETALLPKDERAAMETRMGLVGMGDPGSLSSLSTGSQDSWSMNAYAQNVQEGADDYSKEAREELERSIIANLADEVSIAIRGNHVEMIVEKALNA